MSEKSRNRLVELNVKLLVSVLPIRIFMLSYPVLRTIFWKSKHWLYKYWFQFSYLFIKNWRTIHDVFNGDLDFGRRIKGRNSFVGGEYKELVFVDFLSIEFLWVTNSSIITFSFDVECAIAVVWKKTNKLSVWIRGLNRWMEKPLEINYTLLFRRIIL